MLEELDEIEFPRMNEATHLKFIEAVGDVYEELLLGAYTKNGERLYVYKRIAFICLGMNLILARKFLKKCIEYPKYISLIKIRENMDCLLFVINDLFASAEETDENLLSRYDLQEYDLQELQRKIESEWQNPWVYKTTWPSVPYQPSWFVREDPFTVKYEYPVIRTFIQNATSLQNFRIVKLQSS